MLELRYESWRRAKALGCALLLTSACAGASAERATVKSVASRSLQCPAGDIEIARDRETAEVREYTAGCDMMVVDVLCSARGCHAAKPKPPCTPDHCFEEDPVTLEWKPGPQASTPGG